jgi:hypothetical protein
LDFHAIVNSLLNTASAGLAEVLSVLLIVAPAGQVTPSEEALF